MQFQNAHWGVFLIQNILRGVLTVDKGICYIVGAGDCPALDFTPRPGDCVVAADGGLLYLERDGIAADLVVGDFDSLARRPNHHRVVALRKEKDETDLFAAVGEGIQSGYTRFRLYGCTGGRIEHTMANIQLLAFLAERKMSGYLLDQNTAITAVSNGSIAFAPRPNGYISVFSLTTKATGVFAQGLKYRLSDAEISNTCPVGVSNEFIGVESEISVREGTLLIVFPRDAEVRARVFR